ncbi:related to HNT1-Adenosine 5`-monophosphoramidase, member of the histidine triad (HIT) superfamily of nucleotide-binding proteins [Hanseniaspora guilliermondii]|uniref:Related to HNT1-Adenosine 5`-monophosphoramidase, member of the histidine triad (HIT) superfamily of nucleotide-binding proteins n=1 Tax=Hanseniaspora guilliermondii TaxID=56406 RepID=A0A1L0CIM4_9ASCO|nr:related to HNT1-Adenosine 5`-monophosphoramidase, member of the histidine triad (HIT) superfamily of nucleotide-binding proteins [Hanseniaspora guilliermondii]
MSVKTTAVHDATCIFCKIIKGEIPSFKVYETSHSFAFLDIQPIAKGHTLVIPKYHGAKLHNLPDEYLADILPAAKKVTEILNLNVDGADIQEGSQYNILQNNGTSAHQVVPHVHFHVIPKPSAEKGLVIGWPSEETDFPALTAFHKEITEKK